MILHQKNQHSTPTHYTMTNNQDSKEFIETGNSFLDLIIKEGLPPGKMNVLVGKSRNVGKSFFAHKMLVEWKKTHRLMKLKRYFNNLDK